jgi:hypothetical protein
MFASAAFRRLDKKGSLNQYSIKPVLTQLNNEDVDDG